MRSSRHGGARNSHRVWRRRRPCTRRRCGSARRPHRSARRGHRRWQTRYRTDAIAGRRDAEPGSSTRAAASGASARLSGSARTPSCASEALSASSVATSGSSFGLETVRERRCPPRCRRDRSRGASARTPDPAPLDLGPGSRGPLGAAGSRFAACAAQSASYRPRGRDGVEVEPRAPRGQRLHERSHASSIRDVRGHARGHGMQPRAVAW